MSNAPCSAPWASGRGRANLRALARAAEQENRFAEAAAMYRSYLKRYPEDDETWHHFAGMEGRRGRGTQALVQLEAAITRNPRLFWAQIAAAEIHRGGGELAKAVASYTRALELDPSSSLAARVLGNIGTLQRERGQTDEALSCFRRATALDAEIAEIQYNFGILLTEIGDIDGATEALQKAVALQPQFAEAHSTLLCIKGLYRHNDPAEVYAEHLQWAQRYANPLTKRAPPHTTLRHPRGELRVGYVSGDFRRTFGQLLHRADIRAPRPQPIQIYC